MPQTLIIHNPNAGNGESENALRLFADQIDLGRYQQTKERGDAEAMAKQAAEDGVARVIAAGGDGTLHEIINGVLKASADKPPSLGLIPCGSANDFAKVLGIEPNVDDALKVIQTGTETPIDIVEIKGGQRPFMINAATGGLSVQLEQTMEDDVKQWWGAFAYARAAAGVIPQAQNFNVRVTVDDKTVQANSAAIVIGNGGYAGNLCMLPEARGQRRDTQRYYHRSRNLHRAGPAAGRVRDGKARTVPLRNRAGWQTGRNRKHPPDALHRRRRTRGGYQAGLLSNT